MVQLKFELNYQYRKHTADENIKDLNCLKICFRKYIELVLENMSPIHSVVLLLHLETHEYLSKVI